LAVVPVPLPVPEFVLRRTGFANTNAGKAFRDA
jgi:hypothetical protein